MLRAYRVTALVAAATIVLLPFQLLSLAFAAPSRRWIPLIYHRLVCALLGIRIHVSGTPAQNAEMIVANHASWLDISVISAAAPVAFVAKSEVATWPLFGALAKLQRSIFVDRARRSKTGEANREIAGRLAAGDKIVLFAEGTSSDGNRVLPFRSALIGAAGTALMQSKGKPRVLIQPLSIAYVGYHGLPMARIDRERAAWYGTVDLLPHLARMLREGRLDVVLSWGEPVSYVAGSDRKIVARALETTVRRLTAAALRSPAPAPRLGVLPQPALLKDVHWQWARV